MTPDKTSGAAETIRDFGPAPKPAIVSQTNLQLDAQLGEAGYRADDIADRRQAYALGVMLFADAFREEGDAWQAVARHPGRPFGHGRRRASA